MKIIKLLSESIEQELDCSEKYAKLALQYKEEFPNASKVFYDLSIARMNGIDNIHTQVTSLISDYRKEKGEPPAPMMAIYNYLHEREINKTIGVKKMQELYKK